MSELNKLHTLNMCSYLHVYLNKKLFFLQKNPGASQERGYAFGVGGNGLYLDW